MITQINDIKNQKIEKVSIDNFFPFYMPSDEDNDDIHEIFYHSMEKAHKGLIDINENANCKNFLEDLMIDKDFIFEKDYPLNDEDRLYGRTKLPDYKIFFSFYRYKLPIKNFINRKDVDETDYYVRFILDDSIGKEYFHQQLIDATHINYGINSLPIVNIDVIYHKNKAIRKLKIFNILMDEWRFRPYSISNVNTFMFYKEIMKKQMFDLINRDLTSVSHAIIYFEDFNYYNDITLKLVDFIINILNNKLISPHYGYMDELLSIVKKCSSPYKRIRIIYSLFEYLAWGFTAASYKLSTPCEKYEDGIYIEIKKLFSLLKEKAIGIDVPEIIDLYGTGNVVFEDYICKEIYAFSESIIKDYRYGKDDSVFSKILFKMNFLK